jgi:2-keto-4-pentenoate hydratase
MNTISRAERIDRLAQELLTATDQVRPVRPLRQRHPDLDVTEAYRIQQHQLRARVAGGEQLVGRKVGLTSAAMQAQLGIDSPDFGFVLDSMTFADGDTASADRFIAPRIEPELAFVLNRPLAGPGVTTVEALTAVEHVFLALEIIDSRVADWNIGLVDTVADNASCGAVVLGREPLSIHPASTSRIGVELFVDGELRQRGEGTAVMNDPLAPLVWLANTLGALGDGLRAGEFVLTGSFTGAVPIAPGSAVRADYGPHGRISINFAHLEETP